MMLTNKSQKGKELENMKEFISINFICLILISFISFVINFYKQHHI